MLSVQMHSQLIFTLTGFFLLLLPCFSPLLPSLSSLLLPCFIAELFAACRVCARVPQNMKKSSEGGEKIAPDGQIHGAQAWPEPPGGSRC